MVHLDAQPEGRGNPERTPEQDGSLRRDRAFPPHNFRNPHGAAAHAPRQFAQRKLHGNKEFIAQDFSWRIESRRRTVELFLRDLAGNSASSSRDWTLEQMARECGLGITAFSKYCREVVNSGAVLSKVDGPVIVPALPVAIKSAKLLNGPSIKTTTEEGSLSFVIPDNSWDEIDTIVELTIEGNAMDIAPLKPATRPSIPGAKATASTTDQNNPQYSADMVLDGDPESRWATPADTKNAWLQIDFDKETTFNGITIDEANSGHGSSVKKFELQKKDGSSWVTFHNGSRLGPHFNASFSPVTTSAIRLNILDATKGPTISEIFIQTP